jgi:TonB family protein
MGKWRLVVGAALLACAGLAFAGVYDEVRKQTEMSLVATGSIDIGPDGKVISYTLDEADKLPPAVHKVLDRASVTWAFEPVLVQGRAVRATTRMSLRFAARPIGEGSYDVRIAGADFRVNTPPEERPTSKNLAPPTYPENAARSGMGGTVYVIARIGRDGRVEDAFAEQVNLSAVDRARAMEGWRHILATAALKAAKTWKFQPPTRGDEVDNPYWRVRVPVAFIRHGGVKPKYGEWFAYIPGPRQSAPWAEDKGSSGSDALVAGGVYPLGGGVKLLTSLNGS